MRIQRALEFAAAAIEFADLFFRIVIKGNSQMATDEAAEGLMQALRFLHVKRQRSKTLGETFTLGVQRFDAVFTGGAAKQRQRRETRIAPLAVGNLHHHRFFQLIDAEYAVIEGLRIAFDQIQVFRAIFQPFELLRHL